MEIGTDGQGSDTITSINDGMVSVEIQGQQLYALSGRFQDAGWSAGDGSYDLEGTSAVGTTIRNFETCALLGMSSTSTGEILEGPWPTFPEGSTEFYQVPTLVAHILDPDLFAQDGSSYGKIEPTSARIGRTGPSEVEIYDGAWKGSPGLPKSRRITLPPEVLHPNDNMFWVSIKTAWIFEDMGRAIDFIPTTPSDQIYLWRITAQNTYYVNGVEVGTGLGFVQNSAPLYDPNYEYIQEIVADSSQQPQQGTTFRTRLNPALPTSMKTVANSTIRNDASAYKLFAAFLDMGEGSVGIANTEQGANLKRIDPNHTPYEDCNCP
jgi:hypothetical protein